MHTTKVEAADGSILMTIEGGGDAAGTAEIIARHFGGKVRNQTPVSQPSRPVQNDVLVLSNAPAASAAPEPQPGAVTPLELPSTAEESWGERYTPPVPYQTEGGTWRKTPLFTENAEITPLELPGPTFTAEENAKTLPKPENYRPTGVDGLVNNGITPLELPTMKF